MANNAQQMHIVPRYNALHNNSTNAILRFSSEAANIRKSGYLFPKISYSPISPAQAEDTNSSEFSNSDTFLMPTLCENTSPHMGIENPSPPPTVDVTSLSAPLYGHGKTGPPNVPFTGREAKFDPHTQFSVRFVAKTTFYPSYTC